MPLEKGTGAPAPRLQLYCLPPPLPLDFLPPSPSALYQKRRQRGEKGGEKGEVGIEGGWQEKTGDSPEDYKVICGLFHRVGAADRMIKQDKNQGHIRK